MSELPQQRGRSAVFVIAFVLALILCAFTGYQRAFSVFASYDDEGYVAISLIQYLKGGSLYNDVYSQYGPAWYVGQSALHKTANLPVTHDVVRLKTLTIWLLTAFLSALVAGRVSRSKLVAFCVLILGFLHLERLTLEPGHPQEICVLAIASLLALATHPGRMGILRLVGMGAIVGLTVLTKLNVGLLLVASTTLAFCISTKDEKWRQRLTHASMILIAIAAIGVTRSTLTQPRGFYLPLLVICAAASVAWVGLQRDGDRPKVLGRHVMFHLAWFASASIVLAIVLSQGTTPDGLLHGVLFQHFGFSNWFYMSPPLFGFTVALGVGSVVIAGMTSTQRKRIVRAVRLGMLAIVVGVMLRHWTDSSFELFHGLQDRGHAGLLVSFVGPLVWVLLHDSGKSYTSSEWFGRVSLACVAALQPLIAYPIPGTQMAVGSLPLLIIAVVCVNDLVRAESVVTEGRSRFAFVTRTGLVTCSVLILATFAQTLYNYRSTLEPLALPGAQRLRLPQEKAEELRELVATIRQNGNTFVSVYRAYNSLYLLSELEPPNGLNATLWPWMLTETEQDRIIDSIKDRPDVCAVDRRVKVREERPTKLGAYLKETFSVPAHVGGWTVLTRP
ncbi:MAG: hypothetical protein AB8G99_11560 [Planctomycetaceae bacterium]